MDMMAISTTRTTMRRNIPTIRTNLMTDPCFSREPTDQIRIKQDHFQAANIQISKLDMMILRLLL